MVRMSLSYKSCVAPNKIHAFDFLDTMISSYNGEVEEWEIYPPLK